MKQIRKSIFETNSSSAHALSFNKTNNKKFIPDDFALPLTEDGYVETVFGCFGCGKGLVLKSQQAKLAYLLTIVVMTETSGAWMNDKLTKTIPQKLIESKGYKAIDKVISKHCNGLLFTSGIIWDKTNKFNISPDCYDYGVIDHQSVEDYHSLSDYISSHHTTIERILFNSNCTILIKGDWGM